MTEGLLDDGAPAGGSGHVGVLATWRETSTQAKALLAGVFVSAIPAARMSAAATPAVNNLLIPRMNLMIGPIVFHAAVRPLQCTLS